MNNEKITIGKGNSKLGNIPSISLPKCYCNKDWPCMKYCYTNSFTRYPNVIAAYEKNKNILELSQNEYFNQLSEYLKTSNIRYFRYHVSGEIKDYCYFSHIVDIAEYFPNISFMLYTKRYDIINEYCKNNDYELYGVDIPKNLNILFSSMIGVKINNPYNFRICYYQDKNNSETRIPENAITCPGKCIKCLACYSVNKHMKDIVIKHH